MQRHSKQCCWKYNHILGFPSRLHVRPNDYGIAQYQPEYFLFWLDAPMEFAKEYFIARKRFRLCTEEEGFKEKERYDLDCNKMNFAYELKLGVSVTLNNMMPAIQAIDSSNRRRLVDDIVDEYYRILIPKWATN